MIHVPASKNHLCKKSSTYKGLTHIHPENSFFSDWLNNLLKQVLTETFKSHSSRSAPSLKAGFSCAILQ